jgi:predicted transcriptional regulator
MEVPLTSEQEAKLSQLAADKRRSAEELAQEVLGFYLDHEARFVEVVQRGLDSLDRGEFVSHQEVGARLQRLLRT